MIHPPLSAHSVAPSEHYGETFVGPCLNAWPDPNLCPPTTSYTVAIRGRLDEHLCLTPAAYPHVCRCVRCGHPNGAAQ